MPLGRGLMIVGRFTIYQTITIITDISPTSAYCGDTVIFTVTVTNNSGAATPMGTVSIVNTTSGTVLGTGTLSSGTTTIVTTPEISLGRYIAIYSGVVNEFASSTSSMVNYNIGANNTIVTVLTTNGLYFCNEYDLPISAHVDAFFGGYPAGTAKFRLFSDNTNYIDLVSGTLDGSGNAVSSIPAYTTTDGYDYWLQALYDGYGCWNSSDSSLGMSGTVLHPILFHTTSTTVGISGNTTFCYHNNITLISTTTSFSSPSAGTVAFTAYLAANDTLLTLGTIDIISGAASLLVPGDTFVDGYGSGVNWKITASYIGDGYCFGNSVSSNDLEINPTIFTTTTIISGPTSYCYTAGANYTVTVASTISDLSLSGNLQVTFYTNLGGSSLIYNSSISGSSEGFDTTVNISGSFGGIGTRYLIAVFTPDSSCFNGSTSNNFNFTIIDC